MSDFLDDYLKSVRKLIDETNGQEFAEEFAQLEYIDCAGPTTKTYQTMFGAFENITTNN